MPGVGVGGLISNLINPGLDKTIADQITPNPNPLNQQGGAPSPAPQGPNLASAAVTQPDPVSANLGQLLTKPSLAENLAKEQRQADLSADLNRNIAGVAAGFGTAQQQASKQAALSGMPGSSDQVGMWQKIQEAQQTQTNQDEHARFMGNAAVLAKSLGLPVDVVTENMNDPEAAKTMFANATTPDAVKNADAATKAWQIANPNATQSEIAQYKSNLLSQSVGGLSMAGKSMMDDRRSWRAQNPGKTDADMIAAHPELANEIAYTGAKTEEGKQMAQAGEDKLTAAQTFPKVNQAYTQVEQNIDWLNQHKDAVLKAVNTPDAFTKDTTGNLIYKFIPTSWTGISDEVLQARSKIDFLKNQLYSENFTGTHNVRSNTEANKLGASATNLDTRTNDAQTVNQQLQQLQQGVYRAQANNYASAGKVVPYKYRGLADATFLDPNSKLFQGGSDEKPATIGSPEDIAKLGHGQPFLIPSGPNKGKVGYAP